MIAVVVAIKDPVRDAKVTAKAAGLRYVNDLSPGIRRIGTPNAFRYLQGTQRVTDPDALARIKRLAIPPAWKEVWICPTEDGHIQATGRDARGRKQYRYHTRWRETRDDTKYQRLIHFAKRLPALRRTLAHDLQLPGLPRAKVLATVVKLLETGLIRVGNDEYARTNRSYGLTTLRDKHVRVRGESIKFTFRGKSGKDHDIDIRDAYLARIVQHCQDLPGQELFQYIDEEGVQQDVTSTDVNAYLRDITGEEFTAKDFRTWAGTVLAAMALQEFEKVDSAAKAKKNILRAVERVAERLGNTPSVCRKCYVHPAIVDSYLEGIVIDMAQRKAKKQLQRLGALQPEEAAVLALLKRRLELEKKKPSLLSQLEASLKYRKRPSGRGQPPKRRAIARSSRFAR